MKGKYLIPFLISSLLGFSQSIDLETITKANLKVSGGINANSVFYNSNIESSRAPFTYLLSGNLNITAYTFSLPLSYSFTNQGNNLNYDVPFNFNRLCLTPKYKWVKAYIGDASMTFSPYTLNGHPFRGLGVEVIPEGPFKIVAMGGCLLKSVEMDEAAAGIPIFKRMGYGTKIGFEKERYKIQWIGFFAKDDKNSIASNYGEKGVAPQQNIVNSLSVNTALSKNIHFNVEYALSVLTHDIRAESSDNNFVENLLGSKENTTYSKAFRTDINYTIQKSKVGLTYERIDPTYTSLGTMYINNDLENIALTFDRPFLKDKLAIAANVGFQRDDLKQQKQHVTKRVVGALNVNYQASQKLTITGLYSNFTTYTNRNLNQFDVINNVNISPQDTLNYRQLSQNAAANVSYAFGKNQNQNLNLNYTIAGQANEQGGIISKGQASTVQNVNLSHVVNFRQSKTALNSSINYTLNSVENLDNISSGASISATKKFLKDRMIANLGMLYNDTKSNLNKNSVMGVKFNMVYTFLKKHNLAFSSIQMFRKLTRQKNVQDLTMNLNYSYCF